VCKKKDRKINKTCNFVEVEAPGDKIGIDVLELTAGNKIFTAVDYFSRKVFAAVVSTKEGKKVVNFLESIYKKFKFKKMISDNGKEFDNHEVRIWLRTKNIKQVFSIPYYHQSNGRIERVNRTIRNACRKTNGPLIIKLKDIVDNYNNMTHRGIGMSPNEAIKPENYELVKKHEMMY
jgi:transposase InsO family protein